MNSLNGDLQIYYERHCVSAQHFIEIGDYLSIKISTEMNNFDRYSSFDFIQIGNVDIVDIAVPFKSSDTKRIRTDMCVYFKLTHVAIFSELSISNYVLYHVRPFVRHFLGVQGEDNGYGFKRAKSRINKLIYPNSIITSLGKPKTLV